MTDKNGVFLIRAGEARAEWRKRVGHISSLQPLRSCGFVLSHSVPPTIAVPSPVFRHERHRSGCGRKEADASAKALYDLTARPQNIDGGGVVFLLHDSNANGEDMDKLFSVFCALRVHHMRSGATRMLIPDGAVIFLDASKGIGEIQKP